MPEMTCLKIRLEARDATTFEQFNSTTRNSLDLSDVLDSRASATHHMLEYAMTFTKKNLATLGKILKKLIPSLRQEMRFELDGEVFVANNFTDPDEIIRIHAALLEDRAKAARRLRPRPATHSKRHKIKKKTTKVKS
jgi:hypothetical protein